MAEANKQGIRELILKADFAKALYTLEIISKENSSLQNSPHFYCLRGILEGLTNRKENALLYLRKAKEMSREQPSLFLDMMVVRFHVLFNEDRMADHLYNLFVEDHPESSLGWSERGIFLYHKGKMAPALESLNIALTFNKENIQALGYKALVHRKIASAEAKDIFRKFLLIEPRNGMEYLSKGEIYENLENYEKARAYISKVLEKSPANLAAIYLKRESFIKEGKFSLAKKFERKIKRMDFKIENLDSLPENRFYVLGKILFFLEQNRFLKNLDGVPVEAGNERELVSSFPSTSKNVERVGKSQIQMAVAKSFDEVQEEKVKIAENYFKKGKDKLKEKRYDEAIEYFNQSVFYNPNHIQALNEIGLIYLITGDEQGYRIDKAVNYFDQILLRDPSNAEAHYNKFVAFLLVGNYEEAISSINMAIALDPENLEYRIDKGVLLSSIKRYEYAIEVFEEVLSREPKNPTAWGSLAFIYKQMGNKKMEVKCLNEFLKLEPKDVDAWFERGMIFKRFAKYETAIKCFDKILSIKRDHYLALKEKGMCLRLLGRKEEGDKLLSLAKQQKKRYIEEDLKLDSYLSGMKR